VAGHGRDRVFARHGRGHRLGGGGGLVRGQHPVQAGSLQLGGERDRRSARPQFSGSGRPAGSGCPAGSGLPCGSGCPSRLEHSTGILGPRRRAADDFGSAGSSRAEGRAGRLPPGCRSRRLPGGWQSGRLPLRPALQAATPRGRRQAVTRPGPRRAVTRPRPLPDTGHSPRHQASFRSPGPTAWP
jgi:hypothetical protein